MNGEHIYNANAQYHCFDGHFSNIEYIEFYELNYKI